MAIIFPQGFATALGEPLNQEFPFPLNCDYALREGLLYLTTFFFSDCVGRFFFFFLQTFDLVIVFTCNEKRPIVRLVFDFNFIKAIVDLH